MAKLVNGILGGFSGKIGTVIVSNNGFLTFFLPLGNTERLLSSFLLSYFNLSLFEPFNCLSV